LDIWWLFPITDAGGCKKYWIVNQYFHSDLKLQKLADFSRWLAAGTTTAGSVVVAGVASQAEKLIEKEGTVANTSITCSLLD